MASRKCIGVAVVMATRVATCDYITLSNKFEVNIRETTSECRIRKGVDIASSSPLKTFIFFLYVSPLLWQLRYK